MSRPADAEALLARAAAGLPVDSASLPRPVARALALADGLGAPRRQVLLAAAQEAREQADLRRAVEVAAAEGRSVARALVAAPPLLGPAVALLVVDAPFAVWSTPAGRVVAAVALGLWALGAGTVRLLVRRALARRDDPMAEALALAAVGVSAGLSVPVALRRAVGTGVDAGGAAQVALWLELGGAGPPPPGPWAEVAADLAAAARAGVGVVEVLRGHARRRRTARHHEALRRAARLGPRLTLPTTLLLLPAAGVLVAAPLVHGLVSSVA